MLVPTLRADERLRVCRAAAEALLERQAKPGSRNAPQTPEEGQGGRPGPNSLSHPAPPRSAPVPVGPGPSSEGSAEDVCTLGTEPGQPDHGAVLERQVLQGGGGGWLERVRRPGAETRVSASGEQPLGAGSPEPWGWGVRTRRGWNGGCPDPRTGQTQPPPLTHLRPEQARPQELPGLRSSRPAGL